MVEHGEYLRQNYARYLEPFLGGGAVFFHLRPERAMLSDLNEALIATYQALRDEPSEVWRHLKRHQRQHGEEYYYLVRSQRPRTSARRAARFIYLNRTCFNGLYRVNLDGVFNVPKGTRNSVILPTDDFDSVSEILQSASLIPQGFSESISQAAKGDFLYVDPPYTVLHNNNNFLRYNERIFSWSDQRRLAECLTQAAKRGACILMSNADHGSIRDLYRDRIWQCLPVSRLSLLASSVSNRRATTELVISNYLDEQGKQVDPRY